MPAQSYDKYELNRPRILSSRTWNPATGVDNSSSSQVGLNPGSREQMDRTWVRTPGFRDLFKRSLPVNNYTLAYSKWVAGSLLEVDQVLYSSLALQAGYANQRTQTSGSSGYGYAPTWCSLDFTDSNSLAVSDVLKKVRDAQWSAPIFIAEGGKSMAMIAKSARRLANGYRYLKRGDIASFVGLFGIDSSFGDKKRFNNAFGRNPRKAAQNAWLEYSYGWRPLVKDVYDAAHTIANLTNKDYNRLFSVTGTGKKQGSTLKSLGFQKYQYHEWKHLTKYGLWYRYASGQPPVAASLGLTNPLEVAWELVPFSFVADWFVPIGDYIQQVGSWNSSTHQFIRGYRLDVMTGKEKLYQNYMTETTSPWFVGTKTVTVERFNRVECEQRYAKRISTSGPPTPTLGPVRLPNSWRQAVSGIALLGQIFDRRH